MADGMKRGISMIVLIHLCLNAETVFAVPSSIKQRSLLSNKRSSEKERSMTPKSSQTLLLSKLNNLHKNVGESTSFESLSSEINVQDDATLLPKIRIRQEKRKMQRKRKKDRNGTKQRKNKKSRRNVKRHRGLGLKQKSCPTRTSYVSKRTAEDIFGDTVNVYPVIHVGKLALDQMFYESFCDVDKCSCAGVDSRKFKSSCETTHTYTYARVVKSGEIGWGYIKVRSGCSCVVRAKGKKRLSTITDLLS
ncbi:venom nerve growth factor 1-like [Mercenaria mercenaria]|uniref:venom nerve growth factor 1-like n=1 Tax=Mercenaria mercenaria TaxID=6596 RepID=UPI00234EF179|nr:venom nerve growth factor 1-like [Mercenaria mercenaria]